MASLSACAAPAPATFTGIVVAVEGSGPADVDRFTVRSADGETVTFEVERLDVARGKPAAHLREHLVTGEQVIVEYEVRDGRHYALSYTHQE